MEELESEAGEEALVSVVTGMEAVSSLRGCCCCGVLNDRGTSRRGEGGRKCLLCVTVLVEGVLDSAGARMYGQKRILSS